MLLVQYEEILMPLVEKMASLPLDLPIYEAIMPIFAKALGIYFHTNYYVARSPSYKAKQLFFSRFQYDLISMFGLNLFYIEISTLE